MSEKTLKPGWAWVKFGDVVKLNTDRCADPVAEGIERYIGLDHIEPEDLRVRRWGLVAEGTTFTNRFKPGQVLFGKRRAYQRKVAVTDFAGVCSGDIYVFEPKNNRLLPELLPFLCQTESFFEHAVGTSAGSLSPRTNWTQLAEYEFALPPMEEQRQIANTLIASSNVLIGHYETIQTGTILYQSLIDSLTSGIHLNHKHPSSLGLLPSAWSLVELNDTFTDSLYGLSDAPQPDGAYPLLRMMNIEDGEVVENDLKYVDVSDEDFRRYRVIQGDVLFNRTNSYELVGRTGIYKLQGNHVFASYLVRVRTDSTKLLPEYLVAFLNTSLGRRQILSFATKGVSQANVNASNLGRILIPLPTIAEQSEMLIEIDSLRSALANLKSRYKDTALFHRTLLDRMFSGVVE